MPYPEQLHQIDGIYVVHKLLSYQILYLVLALLGGDVQRRVHVLGDGVHLGSVLQQQHNDVHVSEPRGNMQRCLLFPSAGIYLGSVAQQDANDVGL